MAKCDPVYTAHQLRRWMAPNARLFVSPNWRRHVTPGSEAAALCEFYEGKYSPDQPRVPAGSPEGGQWTKDGEASGTELSGGVALALRMTCESQYEEDLDICRRLHLQACYEQAALRYSQCLRGRSLAPFPYR